MSKSMHVFAFAAALTFSHLYGGQNGYYAIVGKSDREPSPTFPTQPWPDTFCRHKHHGAVSVCERPL